MKFRDGLAVALVAALLPLSATAQQTDCRIANFVGDWRLGVTLFSTDNGDTFQNICDLDLNAAGIGRAVCMDYFVVTNAFGTPPIVEPELFELGVRMSVNPNNCVVRASFDIVEGGQLVQDAAVLEGRAYSSRGGWPNFVDGFLFATIFDPGFAAIHPIPGIPGTLTMQRRGWNTPFDLLAAWDALPPDAPAQTAGQGPRRHAFRAR